MSILTIDQRRRAALLENREIQLTPQEYRLLECLAHQLGQVVDKQTLLTAMWGDETLAATGSAGNPMAVDLVVFRLRKKLQDDARTPRYLETRRGFGYMLHNAQIRFAASGDASDEGALQALPKLIERPLLATLPDTLLEGMDTWSTLTQREWELFMQLGQEESAQLTNRALARRLGMTENTLKKHLQNLYRKLRVSNRASAAILSARVQLHLYSEQMVIKGAKPMDSSQQQQNEAIVWHYYQALAAKDTAIVAPYLTEDVVRIGVISPDDPPAITRGKAQLLARMQRVIDDNGEVAVTQMQAAGNKVTCHVRISTDMARREGIAPLTEDVEFLLQDGKILSFKVVSTPEAAAKIRATMA